MSAADVPSARVISTPSMRGHLATAVAPPAECLAAAEHSASAGATEEGCFPTSSIQRRRGRIPARNMDAIGSAARVMALARRFSRRSPGARLCFAGPGPAPSSSAWSSSSAGSGGTVPSSRSVIGPVAAVHVVGTNVKSGGSPPRHTGAVAPVAATRDGGAHSAQSSHHVAPSALAAMESSTGTFDPRGSACTPPIAPTPAPTGPARVAVARRAAPTPPAPQSAPPASDDRAAAAAAAAGRWSSSRHRRSVSTAS